MKVFLAILSAVLLSVAVIGCGNEGKTDSLPDSQAAVAPPDASSPLPDAPPESVSEETRNSGASSTAAPLDGESSGRQSGASETGSGRPSEFKGDGTYQMMNAPGIVGRIVFNPDGTFDIFMGPHNSEGVGISGTFEKETPTSYILNADERSSMGGPQTVNEVYTARVEQGKLIVRNKDGSVEHAFYIPSDAVMQPDQTEASPRTADTQAVLNLRKGPGTEHGIILEIPAFYPVTVKGSLQGVPGWVYVQYENITGWVATEWLSDAPDSRGTLNGEQAAE